MAWAKAAILLLLLSAMLSPIAGRAQDSGTTVEWVVSDGGGVEAGGNVTVTGLPDTIAFGTSYTVTFSFVVRWFDWGSNIRPQTIEWYAKAGCLEETFGICVRNSQNITLGSSTVPGSFASNQTFSVTASLSLKDRLSTVNGTSATLGVRIGALIECLDSSVCSPVGGVNPAQRFSFLRPESSVSFNIFSPISQNVIRNPSFEEGVNPTTGYPAGWGNWTKHGGSNYSITVDNTTAVDQLHSARLEIGNLFIGFIALTQDLLPNTYFSNLTDRADDLDAWFKLQPKYSGMGDVRFRILYGENVAELNYVIDADPLLYYPNSTFTFEDGRNGGVKSILISNSTLERQGDWFHFKRNLRADWAAPLILPGGSTARGFSLSIPFPRIQFDILSFRNTNTNQYFAETAWVDNVKLWLDITPSAPPLDIDFTSDPGTPRDNDPVSFIATASGGVQPYTFSWDFGDSSTGTGNPVSHIYSLAGNFLVRLTVTDSNSNGGTISHISHAVTVRPALYSLVFHFTDQNSVDVDNVVKWKLLNATDGTSIEYQLGAKTLPTGHYTIETYYPNYTNVKPEPYVIFRETIGLDGNLSRTIPLSITSLNSAGDYLAFNNSTVSAQVLSQNSTMLTFNATGSSGIQYVILARLQFLPQAIIRTDAQRVLLTAGVDWTYNATNMIARIETSELGRFAITAEPALRIPIITFTEKTGQPLDGLVTTRISNSKDNTISPDLQGKIPQDENFPYYSEAFFRGYLVYRSILGFSTTDPVQQLTVQLEIVKFDSQKNSYIALNTTVTSMSFAEHSKSRITFTMEGTGPALIVVDVPKRPLYVERNGARIASWTYNSTTNAIAIEADPQGTFTVVLEQPADHTNYFVAGGAATTLAAALIGLTWQRRRAKRGQPHQQNMSKGSLSQAYQKRKYRNELS